MKPTKENIQILKKLGFELEDTINNYNEFDQDASWIRQGTSWGFVMDCMPDFKTLISRLITCAYNDGYDDKSDKKKRLYGEPNDR
jgi:hypothetical protein